MTRPIISHTIAVVAGAFLAWAVISFQPKDETESSARRQGAWSSLSQNRQAPALDKSNRSVSSDDAGSRPNEEFDLRTLLDDAFWNIPEKLSGEQADAFLETFGRTGVNLLAAGELTGDQGYWREAMKDFPDDPHVQLMVLSQDIDPKKRDEWTRRFRESQPDNALSSYYATMMHLRQGDEEAVVEELRRGATLDFDSLIGERSRALEEALTSAGTHSLGAKFLSVFGPTETLFPQWRREFSEPLLELARRSNPETALEIALAGAVAGNQFAQGSGGETMIAQVVGMAMETLFLNELPHDGRFERLAGTPAALLAEIQAQSERFHEQFQRKAPILLGMDETQAMHYINRVRQFGEAEAMAWLDSTQMGRGADLR